MAETQTIPVTASKWLKLRPSRGVDPGEPVGRQEKVIYGAAILSKGEAKGHDLEIDDTSLDQLVKLGNSKPNGLKARFTHPHLSGDGLGSYLGRWRNFRRDGDVTRADLHLSDRAFNTPQGDLGGYVLDMAADEPEAFGVSIAFPIGSQVPRKKAGKKQEANLPSNVLRLTDVHAADVVDQPAANEGFFDLPDWPARQAAGVLDYLFGDTEPGVIRERVSAFLDSYLSERGEPTMSEKPKTDETVEPETFIKNLTQADLDGQLAAAKEAGEKAAVERLEPEKAEAIAAAKTSTQEWAIEVLSRCELATADLTKAIDMLKRGLSVEEAKDELLGLMAKRETPLGSAGGTDLENGGDPEAEWRKDYKLAGGQRMLGVSEEEYFASRRITEAGGELEWTEK